MNISLGWNGAQGAGRSKSLLFRECGKQSEQFPSLFFGMPEGVP
jgi:hypothetical protein